MFRIVFLGVVLGIVVPAFLFGRAVAIVRGLAVGALIWMVFIIFWCLGEALGWFSPSLGTILLIAFVFSALDILVLSILASLAVSKPDGISVAKEAKDAYDDLPPETKAATKRVAAAFFNRMATKQKEKKPGLVADILTEISKCLS